MEKQVFSLSDRNTRNGLVFGALLWVAWLVLRLCIGHNMHDRYWHLALLVLVAVGYPARYWAERVRCLQIGDDGLVLKRWLRKDTPFRWDAISKVELFEKPSFWTARPFLYIIAKASSGRGVRVPVYPPGFQRSWPTF